MYVCINNTHRHADSSTNKQKYKTKYFFSDFMFKLV